MSLFDEITNGQMTLNELEDPDTEEYRMLKKQMRKKLDDLRALLDDGQKTALEEYLSDSYILHGMGLTDYYQQGAMFGARMAVELFGIPGFRLIPEE